MTTAIDPATYGLQVGTPEIKSMGTLAFGPDGILFVADNVGAKIFALAVESGQSARQPVDIDQLDTRLASFLGCSRDDVVIRDMAVHPASGEVFFSVVRNVPGAVSYVLVKAAATGELSEVSLAGIPFAATDIEKPPAESDERQAARVLKGGNEGQPYTMPDGREIRVVREPLRSVTVTDMAYADGVLLVAGASNEEFSSSFRRIPFPFGEPARINSLEIFHVSHGRFETASPISTFLPYGEGGVLASYTCTPLVQFSLQDAAAGDHVKGKSVADLGPGSTPLDMVAYRHDGEEYFLVSNAVHPLMKIPRSGIERQEPLLEQADHVGAPREELPQQNVSYMGNLDGSHVLMLQRDEAGNLSLRSYATSSL
jgi:hypothetical protein